MFLQISVYLEFDLENILQISKEKLFKYFYAFFAHDTFVEKEGQSFLDAVYRKNVRFAREVKKDLDENVYKALRELAAGFLNYNNDLSKEDIDKIRDKCLILLYRLLSLFYAEAKDLIEFTKHSERYSLQKLSRDIKAEDVEGKTYVPLETRYWHRIKQTFKLIDKRSQEALGEQCIPAYNGDFMMQIDIPF